MKIKNWYQFSIFDFKRKLNGRMTHGPIRHQISIYGSDIYFSMRHMT